MIQVPLIIITQCTDSLMHVTQETDCSIVCMTYLMDILANMQPVNIRLDQNRDGNFGSVEHTCCFGDTVDIGTGTIWQAVTTIYKTSHSCGVRFKLT